MPATTIARGLGWFGIGLGLVEVFTPAALGRAIGLDKRTQLLRLFGLREIAAGLGLIGPGGPARLAPWLWARVAGDALDGAVLASGLAPGNRHRQRTLLAIAAVAPVVILDVVYALKLSDDA